MYSDRVDSVTRATNPSPSPSLAPPVPLLRHLPFVATTASSSISSITFSFATFASFCFSASTCSDASACKARSRGQTSDLPFPLHLSLSPPFIFLLHPFLSPTLLPVSPNSHPLARSARLSSASRATVSSFTCACVYVYIYMYSREVARLSGPLTYYREPPLACL